MDAEDMLYILYTSGTTGKPKGIVHTTGGYLTGRYATTKWVFDLKEEDVYWCTADIGWVTGHSYVVYGPLANGATVVMYEGAPDFPHKDRFWDIVERYGVTIFYTAPTAIRAFMRWGTEWPEKHDLSSLRLLGSVGEPINPEAWMWYHLYIGTRALPDRRHVVADRNRPHPDHAAARHHAHEAGLGDAAVPGHQGRDPATTTATPVDVGGGLLALTRPWPGDAARHLRRHGPLREAGTGAAGPTDIYFTGDGAKRDDDGYFWLLGRVDDVLNVAGHRIGTMEVESALVDHPKVAECAVVGRAARHQGPGGRGVRDGEGRRDRRRRRWPRSCGTHVGAEDRRDREARRHHLRGRPAEDALGQDHAAAAARHRRGQGARRHHDAGRSRTSSGCSRRNTRRTKGRGQGSGRGPEPRTSRLPASILRWLDASRTRRSLNPDP